MFVKATMQMQLLRACFLLSRLRFWRIGCLSGAVQLDLG